MTIVLNHTIVPARDKRAAARFFAEIFGLELHETATISRRCVSTRRSRSSSTKTRLSESHHYAFHVNDVEFDAIFARIKKAGLAYGSAPWSLDDGKLNDWNGGRGVYFKDPNGHVLELMTVPQ